MEKDFHFYVIGILAKHAGFTDREALTIATASQYVDDATETYPIYFDDGRIIETTMTAHYHVKAITRSVQNQVYMCFHFLPEGRVKNTFSFRTKPDPDLLKKLFIVILDEHEKEVVGLEESEQPLSLYRLGVALHTYADTWAHQSFSSRLNRENNVGAIKFEKTGKWKKGYWKDYRWDLAPTVGHCQCGHYPDHPFQHIKYGLFHYRVRKQGFQEIERDNRIEFKKAAKACLDVLCSFQNTKNGWNDQAPAMITISDLFRIRIEKANKRIKEWRKMQSFFPFKKLFSDSNDYDSERWKKEAFKKYPGYALGPKGWDGNIDYVRAQPMPDFDISHFRKFHKAARKQRVFILDELFW